MSADRELLKLAAKAAGFAEIDFLSQDHWANVYDADGRQSSWNPLTDDGDALRLAILLRIDIEFHWREGGVSAMNYEACGEFNMQGASEQLAPDDSVATRRAIVRAAAQFGERMQ